MREFPLSTVKLLMEYSHNNAIIMERLRALIQRYPNANLQKVLEELEKPLF